MICCSMLVNMEQRQADQWLAISSKEAWVRAVAPRRYHRLPGPRVRPRQA